MCFNQDAERSCCAFDKYVTPVLRYALNAVKILPTERHKNELEAELDRNAGIDGLIVNSDGWTFGYSSRVQFGTNYGAFSVRRSRPSGVKTEFDKLCNPLQTKPTYHIQTFVVNEQAVIGVVETVELVQYISKHPNQWRKTSDGETFYYVPFDEVAAKVYCVVAGQVFEKKKAA